MTAVARRLVSAARLFSAEGFHRIRSARVGIVGLGGVGSWAAEALARSGVGHLVLVDTDHVAESNMNRQVQATRLTLGMAKTEALSARIGDLAEDLQIEALDDFLGEENVDDILPRADFWIDACDDLKAKLCMVRFYRQRERPRRLVVSGGAGGKTDSTRVMHADLANTHQDPLLSKMRHILRRSPGMPREGKMFVPVVYCAQAAIAPADCEAAAKLACAGYGSLVTVTAAMGMAAASRALTVLSSSPR